jgi:hypothetical protein
MLAFDGGLNPRDQYNIAFGRIRFKLRAVREPVVVRNGKGIKTSQHSLINQLIGGVRDPVFSVFFGMDVKVDL